MSVCIPYRLQRSTFLLINDLKQSDFRVLFLTLKDVFSSILRHKKANSKDLKTLKQTIIMQQHYITNDFID